MARSTPDLTPDRAHRLCKMLRVLGNGPQTKGVLEKKLQIEERGFYRDLKLIRGLGISITNDATRNRYRLAMSLDDALSRLPVPDLKLSLREMLELSNGRSPIQKAVRRKLEAIVGPVSEFEKPPVTHRVHLEGAAPMNVAIVIPARFASTRLPAKPLLRETGKYLVQHVYERACEVKSASRVIVATDDARIAAAVRSFGGEVAMTDANHVSGTDRIAEVASTLDVDTLVNLQGDEPLFEPASIETLIDMMRVPGTDMATLAVPIPDAESYRNPNVVKVVCDDSGRALYFSRSPLPYFRDDEPDLSMVRQHLGVYAYRREFLLKITKLPPHPLELAEKLEQLRVLGHGGTLRVGTIPHAHRGVDTPDDYAAFVRHYLSQHRRAA